MLQTFDDKKKDKSLAFLSDPTPEAKKRVLELNKLGAGIFYTPNMFKGHRKQSECLGVNAWFFEIDDIPKEEQFQKIIDSPLVPSFVVESEKSYHVYFLAEDGTIENFRTIQKGLIHHFQSDPAIHDITRVMRLPGFNHWKKDEPFMVKVVVNNPCKYTEKEMLENFPYIENEKIYTDRLYLGDTFWDRAGKLNCEYALQKLSGSRWVSGEVFTFRKRTGGGFYIDCNGKQANCWIDHNGMIGSGSKAGPTIVQWLSFYGNDKKAIYQCLSENFHELKDRGVEKKRKKEIDLIDTVNKNPRTWGTSELDKTISPIEDHHYILMGGESGSGKTSFLFDLAKKNSKTHKVLFLSLEMTKEKLIQQYARKRAGIRKEEWRTRENIPESQKDIYKRTIKEFSENKNLIIEGMEDGAERTTLAIEKIVLKHEPSLVILDNLDLIEIDDSLGRTEEQKRISEFFMNFTNTYEIPIIVIHHFKKDKLQSRGMDSFLGSAKITHGADLIITGKRNDKGETEMEKAEYTVLCLKDRDFGDIGARSTVYFNKGTFEDHFTSTI